MALKDQTLDALDPQDAIAQDLVDSVAEPDQIRPFTVPRDATDPRPQT